MFIHQKCGQHSKHKHTHRLKKSIIIMIMRTLIKALPISHNNINHMVHATYYTSFFITWEAKWLSSLNLLAKHFLIVLSSLFFIIWF